MWTTFLIFACSRWPPAPEPTPDDWNNRVGIATAYATFDAKYGKPGLRETYDLKSPDGQEWPIATTVLHWNDATGRYDHLYQTGPTKAEIFAKAMLFGSGGTDALVAYHLTYLGPDFVVTDVHLHSLGDDVFYEYRPEGDHYVRIPLTP